jgi:hypothetical protein
LRNNYYQALNNIRNDGRAVEEAKSSMGITDQDLVLWKAECEEYFQTLGEEPESQVRAIAYVKLLQKLRELE